MAGGAEPRAGRRSAGAVVVLIALAGSLAACSDDPRSPPPPSSSSTASSGGSATPTPTLPVAPEARPTAESAEAFVRYSWDVYNYSYRSLDTGPLTSIAASTCKFCSSTASEIAELRAARKHTVGGEIQLGSVAAPPGDLTKGVIVTTVLSQEPGRTFNNDGTLSSTLKAVHNMRSEIALRWKSSWIVYGVANDETTGAR